MGVGSGPLRKIIPKGMKIRFSSTKQGSNNILGIKDKEHNTLLQNYFSAGSLNEDGDEENQANLQKRNLAIQKPIINIKSSDFLSM